MKKISLLCCFVFAACFGAAQNYAGVQAALDKKLNAVAPAKQPTALSIVLEAEKPSPYQKAQIMALYTRILAQCKAKKFTSYTELINFINSFIKGEGEDEDTILLKDAFPSEAGTKARGKFDCDSRAIIALSVVEALNYPFGKLYLLDMTGHVVLYSGKVIYDLRDSSQYSLSDRQRITAAVLDDTNKIKSLVLSNVATDYAQRGSGGPFKREDGQMLAQSKELFKQAIQLNPKNITALYNLHQITDDFSYKTTILGVMISNYKDVFAKPVYITLNPDIKKLQKVPQAQETIAVEAIKNSPEITSFVHDLLGDSYYKERKDLTIFLEDNLIKAGKNNVYSDGFAARAYFDMKNYDEFFKFAKMTESKAPAYQKGRITNQAEADKAGNDLAELTPEEFKEKYAPNSYQTYHEFFGDFDEMKTVADIIEGRLVVTPQNLPKLADVSPVLNLLYRGGTISTSYMTPTEALRSWEGCKDLMRSLKGVAKKDESFCDDIKVKQ